MQLIERIRRVGNKLPQKDLVIRIDGMNHQVEKLFCFCLKFMLYFCHEKIPFTQTTRTNVHFVDIVRRPYQKPANRSAPFGLDLLGFHGKIYGFWKRSKAWTKRAERNFSKNMRG